MLLLSENRFFIFSFIFSIGTVVLELLIYLRVGISELWFICLNRISWTAI